MKSERERIQTWIQKAMDNKKFYRRQIEDEDYDHYESERWKEIDVQRQKEFQDALERLHKQREREQLEEKRKRVCLLCGEEVPGHPMICPDCKRVFAAFKSILVEEKQIEEENK